MHCSKQAGGGLTTAARNRREQALAVAADTGRTGQQQRGRSFDGAEAVLHWT